MLSSLPCVTERAGVLASRPGSGGSWLELASPDCPWAGVSLSEPSSLCSPHACGPDGHCPICPDIRTDHYTQLHSSGLQCKHQKASAGRGLTGLSGGGWLAASARAGGWAGVAEGGKGLFLFLLSIRTPNPELISGMAKSTPTPLRLPASPSEWLAHCRCIEESTQPSREAGFG